MRGAHAGCRAGCAGDAVSGATCDMLWRCATGEHSWEGAGAGCAAQASMRRRATGDARGMPPLACTADRTFTSLARVARQPAGPPPDPSQPQSSELGIRLRPQRVQAVLNPRADQQGRAGGIGVDSGRAVAVTRRDEVEIASPPALQAPAPRPPAHTFHTTTPLPRVGGRETIGKQAVWRREGGVVDGGGSIGTWTGRPGRPEPDVQAAARTLDRRL